MQFMDEQPSRQPINQQSASEPFNRESQEGQIPGSIQEPPLEQKADQVRESQALPEPQGNVYRGASEQIPFSPPAPMAYSPGVTPPPQPEAPVRPVYAPGSAWTYPPRPDQYP